MIKHITPDLRKNKTKQWLPADSEERYKEHQADGTINYTRDEFDYKFNSDGFRCDNFTEHSDLPILFLGCSYTQGVGLPIETTWPKLILNKIRQLHPDKNIPHWSLAIGGTGIDTMAFELARRIDTLKPKYIFYHLGFYIRRDYCNEAYQISHWAPTSADLDDPMSKLFTSDEFAIYQFYRSLTIIDLAARLQNSKIFIFDTIDMPLHIIKQIFDDFPNITYIRTKFPKGNLTPEYVKNELTQEEFNHFKTRPTYARDNMHPGELWQFMLAKDVWNNIKKEFI